MIYCSVWNLRELIKYTRIKCCIGKMHNQMAMEGNVWRLCTSNFLFLVVNKVLLCLTEAVLVLLERPYSTALRYPGILNCTMIHRNRFLPMAFSHVERHTLKIMHQRTILTTSCITHLWVYLVLSRWVQQLSRNRLAGMKEMGICSLHYCGAL